MALRAARIDVAPKDAESHSRLDMQQRDRNPFMKAVRNTMFAGALVLATGTLAAGCDFESAARPTPNCIPVGVPNPNQVPPTCNPNDPYDVPVTTQPPSVATTVPQASASGIQSVQADPYRLWWDLGKIVAASAVLFYGGRAIKRRIKPDFNYIYEIENQAKLRELTKRHRNTQVLSAVAMHRNAPTDVLRNLAHHPSTAVAYFVANNSNTPQDAQEFLLGHSDTEVARAARAHLPGGEHKPWSGPVWRGPGFYYLDNLEDAVFVRTERIFERVNPSSNVAGSKNRPFNADLGFLEDGYYRYTYPQGIGDKQRNASNGLTQWCNSIDSVIEFILYGESLWAPKPEPYHPSETYYPPEPPKPDQLGRHPDWPWVRWRWEPPPNDQQQPGLPPGI